MAKSISVAAGTSETIRDGCACAIAQARQRTRPTSSAYVAPWLSLRLPSWPRGLRLACIAGASTHALLINNHKKNGPPMSAVTMPTGSSMRRDHRAGDQIARHQERRAEAKRGGHDQPVIGADEQPHQVRHDDPDEADRPADGHRGAGGERRAEKRQCAARADVHAAAAAAWSSPSASTFSAAAATGRSPQATTSIGSAASSGW